MGTEPLTLYKLMILYMLGKVDFPLTNSQLSEFILDKQYTNYFSFQTAINDLAEAEMIRVQKIHTNTYYSITDDGEETLGFFSHKIPEEIRSEIDLFLKNNQYNLRNENEVIADYYEDHPDCFMVHCEIRDRKELLAGIDMTVTDKEQADAICDNWKKNYEDVYEYLVHTLMFRH